MPQATMIIIDDEEAQLQLSVVAFAKILPRVQVVPHHLRKGHELPHHDHADLVLLDYLLGGTTATAILPGLKQRFGEALTVVVFSNTTEPLVEQEVRQAGAAALIGKPFSIQDVQAIAARLVELCPVLRSSEASSS